MQKDTPASGRPMNSGADDVALDPTGWTLRAMQQAIAVQLAIDAMRLALTGHGISLMSDPPKDAWTHHSVAEKLHAAIAALSASASEGGQT